MLETISTWWIGNWDGRKAWKASGRLILRWCGIRRSMFWVQSLFLKVYKGPKVGYAEFEGWYAAITEQGKREVGLTTPMFLPQLSSTVVLGWWTETAKDDKQLWKTLMEQKVQLLRRFPLCFSFFIKKSKIALSCSLLLKNKNYKAQLDKISFFLLRDKGKWKGVEGINIKCAKQSHTHKKNLESTQPSEGWMDSSFPSFFTIMEHIYVFTVGKEMLKKENLTAHSYKIW